MNWNWLNSFFWIRIKTEILFWVWQIKNGMKQQTIVRQSVADAIWLNASIALALIFYLSSISFFVQFYWNYSCFIYFSYLFPGDQVVTLKNSISLSHLDTTTANVINDASDQVYVVCDFILMYIYFFPIYICIFCIKRKTFLLCSR